MTDWGGRSGDARNGDNGGFGMRGMSQALPTGHSSAAENEHALQAGRGSVMENEHALQAGQGFATEIEQALPAGQGSADEAKNEDGETANAKRRAQELGWTDMDPYDYVKYTAQTSKGHAWESNAAVYEWDGEHGEIGPEFPELEKDLFGTMRGGRMAVGLDFDKLVETKVEQSGPVRIKPVVTFETAGLHPAMARNIELAGYTTPTPIQMYCIPAVHQGCDVIGIAQTGSGKTAAYLIPILNALMGKAKKLAAPRPNPAQFVDGLSPPVRAEPLVLILVPSRELAVQIFNEARKFCYRSMLRPCVVYGGGTMGEQLEQLRKGCDVLIASPGRLVDMMGRPDRLSLRRLRYMVIDEADEMLSEDWEQELQTIMTGGEQEDGTVKYLLFSATFPKRLRDLAKEHVSENHVHFRVGRAGSTHENITQRVIYTDPRLKREALFDLLASMPPSRTIIFVNMKRTADELDDVMYNSGFPCTSMHSDRTQLEREDAMRAFRSHKMPILITTGVSARGIDVPGVMHVINYDLPSMNYGGIEEYTHRIGRTGRIGYKGLATSFYTEHDEDIASVLTRTLLETNQEVPDFLEEHIPEGEAREKLKFEADSDSDGSEAGDGPGDDMGAATEGNNGDDGGSDAGAQDNHNGADSGTAAEGGNNGGGGWGVAAQDNHNGGGWGAAAQDETGGGNGHNNNRGQGDLNADQGRGNSSWGGNNASASSGW